MAISVGVINDHAIVTAGIKAVLAPYSRRVRVHAMEGQLTEVDVVLCDLSADPRGTVDTLLWQNHARLIATGWDLETNAADATWPVGVEGYISLRLTPAELVDAIERAHRGELTVPGDARGPGGVRPSRWLGEELGLSERGSEVLVLVCQGLGNAEIAALLYLSVNTVKTYIRTAYSRIGVTTRPQAVIWGIAHGFGSPTPVVDAARQGRAYEAASEAASVLVDS